MPRRNYCIGLPMFIVNSHTKRRKAYNSPFSILHSQLKSGAKLVKNLEKSCFFVIFFFLYKMC